MKQKLNEPLGARAKVSGHPIVKTVARTLFLFVAVVLAANTHARAGFLPCTPPTITSTTPVSVCGFGDITLNATASSGTVNWYLTSSGGTSLHSGNSFPTFVSSTTTFYVEASDAGCVSTERTAVVATVNEKPTATATASTGTACVGNVLSLTATASGGTTPYTYSWTGPDGFASASNSSPNASTAPLTIDGAGFYGVTVTDANGCTGTSSALVSVYSNPTLDVVGTPNPVCTGNILSLSSGFNSGGSGFATYSWTGPNGFSSTGENPGVNDATSACAGVYTVIATDSHGCVGVGTTSTISVVTNSVTVTTSGSITICNGSSATLTCSGGSTYDWNPGTALSPTTGSTVTANPTTTTTYIVTAHSGNCNNSASVTVTVLPEYPVTASAGTNGTISETGSTNVCSGTDKTYTVTPDAGYHIEDVAVDGTSIGNTPPFTISNVTGSHTIAATFAPDCTTPSITSATGGSVCGSGTVSLSASASAGTLNWYASSTGGTSLQTGGTYTPNVTATTTYYVEATDASCVSSRTAVTATVNSVPSASASATDVSCYGQATGSVTVTGSGGTPSYTVSGDATTGLAAGTYNYVVTDANGCTASTSATVGQPSAALSASSSVTDALCNGGNTGTVTIAATGGTTGYTGTGTFSGKAAGTYSYTVTDANGCTATTSATVGQPSALNASASVTDVLCNGGNTGTVTVSATGGTTGYTGTGTFSGKAAGTYSYTVTDANGCTATTSATVGEPSALTATSSVTDVLCNGGNTGSVTISGNGGAGSYTGTGTFSGKVAGTYSYTITDANGCSATTSAVVGEPSAALSVSASVTDVLCNGGNNGSITISATGGTTGYTGTGTYSGKTAGSYSYTVTDANGCSATATATVSQPSAALSASASVTNVLCNGGNTGTVTVSATGGTTGYTGVGTFTGKVAGTYSYTVTDANGCTATASATVTEPATALSASSTVTNALCYAGNTGSVTIAGAGGTTPYTGTGTFNNLSAGSFSYTVTDANGCTASTSGTVTAPDALTISSITATGVSCNSANGGTHSNGSISTSVTGGTGSYSYSWTGGATDANPTALSAGTYSVTVTDANGCTTTGSVTVSAPGAINVSVTPTNVSCNSATSGNHSNGSIATTVSGGTGSYTYSWSGGASGANPSGLSTGTYSVTVTDGNSCTSTATATVGQPSALTVSTTPTDVSCSGANGNVATSVSGGTSGYTYLWSNSQTNATNTGLAAGTYSVTVTDANSCTATASATVGTSTTISSTITGSTSALGSLVSTFTGPSGMSSYSWSVSGGNHICDAQCHHNSAHSCGPGCDHYGHACTSACHHYSGHTCSNNHTGDHHCNIYCHHNSGHTCDSTCDHYGHACTTACHHNSGHHCNHQHYDSPYISGSATGSSVNIVAPCAATVYTVTLNVSNSGGCTSTSTKTVTVSPSATITVYSSLYTVGSGHHPGVTKSALAADLKVYNRHTAGGRDANQSHYASTWSGTTGQVTNISISSPETVSMGGGPAYRYTIVVPAAGHYLVIGKSEVASTRCGGTTCTIYTGKKVGGHDDVDGDGHDHDDDDDDDMNACADTKVRFHSILKDQNGKCTEADTHQEHGSLMLVVSPLALDFSDSIAYLPVVYESVEGDWSVSVAADPPYGFYTDPPTELSTSVTDSIVNAVQFDVIDTGSEWTFTKLTHVIQHKGAERIATSKPIMVNSRTNKPSHLDISPNPANDEIRIVMSSFEGKATVYIYNMLGQVVAQQPINVISGASVSMDISRLVPGVYMVSAENTSGKAAARLIKSAK